MPRGITQDDVWKACDALLLEGARPTIERVRQKIGSGSPNTVSPYLETWFKHLGGRIKDPGTFAPPADVPDPVLQAAKHFWEAALAQTRLDFEERLQKGLADAVANVESEKEKASQANAAAFEAAGKAARLEASLEKREVEWQREQATRIGLEARLNEARDQATQLRSELDQARAEGLAARDGAQRAVDEAIHRLSAMERRAMLEIDAERTGRARAEKRSEGLEQRLEAAQVDLRALGAKRAEEVGALRAQVQGLQVNLDAALGREQALQRRVDDLISRLAAAELDGKAARAQAELAERLITSRQTSAKPRKMRAKTAT